MNKGFSLVELIVVIAIMAILVGVAVPVYTQYITSANASVDKQTAGEVEHAIEVVLIDPSVTAKPAYNTLVVNDSGLAYLNGGTVVAAEAGDAFFAAVAKIVPSVKTETQYTFTIGDDGYSVTVDPALN